MGLSTQAKVSALILGLCMAGCADLAWAGVKPSVVTNPSKEVWKITAYCACRKCCGKSDAITASGRKARPNHTVALNWLPFGTRVLINGVPYVVEDRGAESHFGTYYHRKGAKKMIKHIDIYMNSHQAARNFGIKWLPVEVVR